MSAIETFENSLAAARRRRRRDGLIAGIALLLALAGSLYVSEARPDRLLEGLPGLVRYIQGTMPDIRHDHVIEDVGAWYWAFGRWLGLLFDTLVMAFLGTLLGAVGAVILCFPASRNLTGGRLVYWGARRLTEFARSIPEFVMALVLVFAFGIGPLAGVLALAIHSAGALAKLFSEINENIDIKPVDGVRAAGGNWLQTIRFGVLPQVLPNFLSYALLRFEINVRAASVLGFVGAGGIGQELMFVIRQFIYSDVSAIVLMMIVTVSLIDVGCETLRHRLVGKELAI